MRNRKDAAVAGLLWIGFFLLYNPLGEFGWYSDVLPNLRIADSLLQDGDLLLTPREVPELLHWQAHGRKGNEPVALRAYDAEIDKLVSEGKLTIEGMEVVVRPSPQPGKYANIFGAGTGLAITPLFALVRWWAGPDRWDVGLMWQTGKAASALFAAGAVAFVYWGLRTFTSERISLLTSVLFGLGTNVFSTSSQTLMQHPTDQFFLSLGIFFYLSSKGRAAWCAASGAALGAAVWCRPTSVMAVGAVGAFFLWTDRKALAAFVAGGTPLGLAFLAHNAYANGSPWMVGQSMLDNVATEVTGSPEIFQTPILYGAAAHLFSPSRGLFVFSPFLLFALTGIFWAWRDEKMRLLRPLSVGLLAAWCVEFKHYDWWGGWSYGYRHLVDTTTILILFLPATLARMRGRRIWQGVFALAAAWSIFVQCIGAWFFDVCGWNNRQVEVQVDAQGDATLTLLDDYREERFQDPTGRYRSLNVDAPIYRGRLWSWSDWEIAYYWKGAGPARELRRRLCDVERADMRSRRIASHVHLADAWIRLEEPELARRSLAAALRLDPENPDLKARMAKLSDAKSAVR